MDATMLSKETVEALRDDPYKRQLVRSVDGQEWVAWVNRHGTIRLTRAAPSVKLKLQGATSEGASPLDGS